MTQLTIDFAAPPSYRQEDFLVSDSNRKAWMWLLSGQSWPQPVFLLKGPPASGKSHLAALWAQRYQAPVRKASLLTAQTDPAGLFQGGQCLVMEDIEAVGDQSALFHLYNYAQQQQNSLLLTMNSFVGWDRFGLADLRSRLQSTPEAQISEPDDMLLAALLIKHLTDRQLAWNDSLIAYVLPRLERSFLAVRKFVAELDALALRKKQPLSITLAREILTNF